MSRVQEQKCYTCWSNPTLCKSYSLYWTPTSEEEVPSPRQPQLTSPLLSISQQCVPLTRSSEHCLCGKRMSSSSLPYDFKISKYLNFQKPRKIRENLELHLIGTQVEETLAEDRQTALIQHLDLTSNTLEALVQYGESLQVSEMAACRVLNVSHLLTLSRTHSANSKPNSSLSLHLEQLETRKNNRIIILKHIIEHCSKYTVSLKHLNELLNDHYIKKKHFNTAVRNFKNLLRNAKLSVVQMEKLNRQYNTILIECQQSRNTLDLELPKMINLQLRLLQEGFEKIKEFFNNSFDGNEIITLFKSIGDKLCTDNSAEGNINNTSVNKSPNLIILSYLYSNILIFYK